MHFKTLVIAGFLLSAQTVFAADDQRLYALQMIFTNQIKLGANSWQTDMKYVFHGLVSEEAAKNDMKKDCIPFRGLQSDVKITGFQQSTELNRTTVTGLCLFSK